MTEVGAAAVGLEVRDRLFVNAETGADFIRGFVARIARDGFALSEESGDRASCWLVLHEATGQFSVRSSALEGRFPRQLNLTVNVDGQGYFFSVTTIGAASSDQIRVSFPAVVYRSERRDRVRRDAKAEGTGLAAVHFSDRSALVQVADHSADGLGLRVPHETGTNWREPVRIRFLDGPRRGREEWGKIRNTRQALDPSWTRVGLSLLPTGESGDVPVESLDIASDVAAAGAADWVAQEPRIVDFLSGSGKRIRAIVDSVGEARSSPVVLIPPAWGKTKETLLPLAATILSTFANAGESVTVIRFDGIRKRGESFNDPECLAVGCESLNYTFTQGASDILAVLDRLDEANSSRRPVVLVTFSVAAIEGRRAIASDPLGRVTGWISAVGAVDPQSLVRQISGGVDYLAGAERGLKYGRQGIQGLLLDIDKAAKDAIDHRIAFLEDARRDFAGLQLPITWVRGKHDGWMDPTRVEDVMTCGNVEHRRIVDVATGHQLKNSNEAACVFRFIASECAKMAIGRAVPGVDPDPGRLRSRSRAEVRRVVAGRVDLRSFWRDYLVGESGGAGMELVTQTVAYQSLMHEQIAALGDLEGHRVLDLGCGTGSFPIAVLERANYPKKLELIGADFVRPALSRARQRFIQAKVPEGWRLALVASDLSTQMAPLTLPIAARSIDSVLASLVINYVQDPVGLLRAVRQVLVPGGRFVFSGLKRDADTSRICVDGVTELRSGLAHSVFGDEGERNLEGSLAEFINNAGRLLDLEERGWFSFWDGTELRDMALDAGFVDVSVAESFGTPSQAWLVTCNNGTAESD